MNGPADRRAATLVMACLGVFVAYLPVITVAASLPAIQAALTTAQLAWLQDAFVLPMAAFILTAGVLGDLHGARRCSSGISARALISAGLLVISGWLFSLITGDTDTSFASIAWRLAPLVRTAGLCALIHA